MAVLIWKTAMYYQLLYLICKKKNKKKNATFVTTSFNLTGKSHKNSTLIMKVVFHRKNLERFKLLTKLLRSYCVYPVTPFHRQGQAFKSLVQTRVSVGGQRFLLTPSVSREKGCKIRTLTSKQHWN